MSTSTNAKKSRLRVTAEIWLERSTQTAEQGLSLHRTMDGSPASFEAETPTCLGFSGTTCPSPSPVDLSRLTIRGLVRGARMEGQESRELNARAFEFLSRTSSSTALEELHQDFLQLVQACGFQTFAFVRLLQAGGPVEPQVVFGDAPAEWVQRYLERDYGQIDPTIPLTFQTRQAFTWRAAEARNRTKEVRSFFGEARELFAADSFIVPVWGPCGELSVVNLLNAEPIEMPEEERAMLRGLCSLYASLSLALLEPQPPGPDKEPKPLGRRELQCLYWMSMGKHDQEIALILGISPLTVRSYIDGARDKLGATSRPELIRKAITLGLLLPERSLARV